MSLNTHDLYELAVFTGRQNDDPLLTIVYSLGQIMAGLGPIFAGPLLGAILTLGGIGVIGVAQGLYQENEKRRREETEAGQSASSSSSTSSSASSSLIIASRPFILPSVVGPSLYRLTCKLTDLRPDYDLTTTRSDVRTCTITATETSAFVGSPLTLTIPDGSDSVQSEALFALGTEVMLEARMTLNGRREVWQSGIVAVTFASSDAEVELTLVNPADVLHVAQSSSNVCPLDLSYGYTKIARCDFPGDLTVSGAVTGGTVFLREKSDGTVEIHGEIYGLTDGQHGFHIHENGGLGNNCKDAGGHFDPAQTEDATGEYAGNLGSIRSSYQVGVFKMDHTNITLSVQGGDYNVLDLAMVVHANPTGGARVGCCAIKEVSLEYVQVAKCEFPGNLTASGSVNSGTLFLRESNQGTVEILGEISGLTDGDYGLHIHEFGGLGNDCKDAGGHFDPDMTEIGNNNLYIGNLGSVRSANEVGVFALNKTDINLTKQDKYDVLDLAMVVHANPTGGSRIGCCAIKAATCYDYQKFVDSFEYTNIARCDFPGDLTVSGAVTGGSIYLREHINGTLDIYGEVAGLTDGDHAFHIHEFGGLGNACADAGGHFDPDQTGGTGDVYAGGLGAISSVRQKASYSTSKSRLNLGKQDKYTVLNLSMVVHATSSGGTRVGCCTIKQFY